MTSLNKKFFKFLSIFTVLSYGVYGIHSYAENAIERDAREYSLGVGEVIQEIKDDAKKEKIALQKIRNQNIYLANNRELKCLADNIYYEAGNQSAKGKLAVAAVTINRVKNPRFPKSVCSVVYQRSRGTCQFSWTCMRKHNPNPVRYAESRKIAEKVLLSGADYGIFGRNVLFYHADYVNPGWNNLRRVTKIGDHIFYAG